MEITILFGSAATTLTLEVEPKDTIETVKQKWVAKFQGMNNSSVLQLFNGGLLLSDTKTLAHYKITNGNTLILTLPRR